ncbi:MAG: tRNA pseudouridine38-40 synthase [Cyclobacteriaceae bacterium]|jgi:tRNA pseudouridine38-40 synthase
MANWHFYYLIRIEFLGFRYHGWQKQTGLKTIHGMIDKTMDFILESEPYRTLGCGRTDAKVSANDYAFELFINKSLTSEKLHHSLNKNLPSDIRVKSVEEVNKDFNVIQDVSQKEYRYYFSSGEKSHPFNAPFIRDFGGQLNIEKMNEAVKYFEGTHNFKRYVSKPTAGTNMERAVNEAKILENEDIQASFTPQKSYFLKIVGPGFMRYQIRLMMGALVEVGRGNWTPEDVKQSLIDFHGEQIKRVAPSSGLVLHTIVYKS